MIGAQWWFVSVMPLVGVVLGVLLKWAADVTLEGGKRRRDDDLRFINERRQVYARLYRAARKLAVIADAHSKMTNQFESLNATFSQSDRHVDFVRRTYPDDEKLNRLIGDAVRFSNEGIAQLGQAIKELSHEGHEVQGELYREYAEVFLIAPSEVVGAAKAVQDVEPSTEPALFETAVQKFLNVARADLTRQNHRYGSPSSA